MDLQDASEFLDGLAAYLRPQRPDDVLRLTKHYCSRHLGYIPRIALCEHGETHKCPANCLIVRLPGASKGLRLDFHLASVELI